MIFHNSFSTGNLWNIIGETFWLPQTIFQKRHCFFVNIQWFDKFTKKWWNKFRGCFFPLTESNGLICGDVQPGFWFPTQVLVLPSSRGCSSSGVSSTLPGISNGLNDHFGDRWSWMKKNKKECWVENPAVFSGLSAVPKKDPEKFEELVESHHVQLFAAEDGSIAPLAHKVYRLRKAWNWWCITV